ncbi:G-type lectin S-receptor-like serine/threonine-protein kinase At4g27290 isoform X2 [Morus notabilis]|uniref:G-type lectin S-receptor-like serine/threonine-protein kinase At4g27290 isoform X2 n=1 Tax=Morus notabilis TaxID=981085 RepID=UPI000CED3529|nr:G-type lectin S-receptor-like serine/threonine-protein kinase At4g27290 isoform X2 [Morus notabilis]
MANFPFVLITNIFFSLFHTTFSKVDSINLFQSISDGETLVSNEGIFKLGFFSPGTSKKRYLGIWYKNIPVQTVVWVANRCDPINDSSGLFRINSTGSLVLLYQNKSVVWSTSSFKKAQKPIAQLLDSGNLVLRDEEDTNLGTYLWQSFDYPSNIILPGMKIGWDMRTGLKRRVSAWKNTNDPCPGDLTFGVEFDPQLQTFPEPSLRKGSAKFHRIGPWNGLRLGGQLELRPNALYSFDYVYNNDEMYYTYNVKNKSLISIVVVNQLTSMCQRVTWIDADQTWRAQASLPRDYCDNYGICGANGICDITTSTSCQCLKGFKPKIHEKWNSMDWSEGCVRNNATSCQEKDKDKFVKLSGLKLPDTTYSWMNTSLNLKECEAKCLSNCSCMAYANTDIRAKGDRDLMAVIIASVVAVVSGMFSAGYYIGRRTLKENNRRITPENGAREVDLELLLFDLSTIATATDNFSMNYKLGEGGFGPVYKGKLEDGEEIAVKRLSMTSRQGIDEFKNEAALIAKLQHRNLVKLLGCCIQGEEKLLVYEYMPNKSLDSFIFDQVRGELLDWPKRFQIICGITRGLLYLHHDSRLRIIHRDLKASNILLDTEMNPKISDFGMARVFGGDQLEGSTNRVMGTYGYMAPEYAYNGHFSIKSDVFSFGIMVLEIVSGKRISVFRPQRNSLTLTGYAWKLMKASREIELLDACLRDSYDSFQVLRCIHVGLLCVQQRPADRPSISSVVVMLGSESELPHPKKPSYFMETDLPQECSESPTSNHITMSVVGGR